METIEIVGAIITIVGVIGLLVLIWFVMKMNNLFNENE